MKQLARRFNTLNFPEYQREPTVWARNAKQRLVDSMSRSFDISSLYFYRNEDDTLDCVDGRQRIGAIMSFLGQNPHDKQDDKFTFQVLNEIYGDETSPYLSLSGMSYQQMCESREENELCAQFVDTFQSYKVTVVELSGAGDHKDFNLQFTRLNLGVIVNSGEKLNAMVGDVREVCFEDLGQHAFLQAARIPTRRFSREQTAAQMLCQIFSLESWRSRHEMGHRFEKTRHIDLQKFFKEHETLSKTEKEQVARTRRLMDLLYPAFKDSFSLRNRAIVVSTVILAYSENIDTDQGASLLASFLDEFMGRLLWQVAKGLNAYQEYHYLVDFQRNITQASVERKAVEERAVVLDREYRRWITEGNVLGDDQCKSERGEDPSDAWHAFQAGSQQRGP